MVELTQAGFELPVIIKANLNCVSYEKTYDGQDPATSNVVEDNGLVMISVTYTAPFTTFAALCADYSGMVAWVLNMDTGELRYYDGTQVVDATKFIDPLYDCIALASHADYSMDSPVKIVHEMGNREAADLKQGVITYKINIDKASSGRWKTTYVAEAAPVPEHPTGVTYPAGLSKPIGLTGIEGILAKTGYQGLDDAGTFTSFNNVVQGREGYTPYFMVIFYQRDNSDTTAGVRAQTTVFQCCKFEHYELKGDSDSMVLSNVKLTAMQMYHAPLDVYQTYEKDLTPTPE